MGTRGLLGHIIRSKNIRKASYNHFDSYPSGLGRQVAKFVQGLSAEQIEIMKQRVAKIEWIENERSSAPQEVQDQYTAAGFSDTAVASKNTADWYCLLRNVQGAASLPHILDGSLTHLVDSTSFENDAVLCEWTYFIDWEEKVVEVRSNTGAGKEAKVGFADVSEKWMEKLDDEMQSDEKGE